jgi:hypothetical protein
MFRANARIASGTLALQSDPWNPLRNKHFYQLKNRTLNPPFSKGTY